MFEPTPDTIVLAIRVRRDMERELRREAKKRKTPLSVEVRRRLQAYAEQARAAKAAEPDLGTASTTTA
jgi:hypothetical protein